MIRIEALNRAQLDRFINAPAFRQMPHIPISRHRAWSQMKNPRLKPEDTLLLVAWLGEEMVGYLGVLPDAYQTPSSGAVRCGWLSCLWVSDEHRGQSIGRKLVEAGAGCIDGQILLTEFTPAAERLYRKLGLFSDLPDRKGIRLYYRLDFQHLLPPKKAFFAQIKPLLGWIDSAGNFLVDTLAWFRRPSFRKARWVYAPYVDKEVQHFLKGMQDQELFRRGKGELNWILQSPWLLSGVQDEPAGKYYFSSWEPVFQYSCIKVYDAKNELQAFLILSRRMGHLKLPCCFVLPGAEGLAAEAINWHIYHWNINMFSTFHPQMVQYYRTKRTFALYKKTIQRQYMATHALAQAIGTTPFEMQDGDGDCFFT